VLLLLLVLMMFSSCRSKAFLACQLAQQPSMCLACLELLARHPQQLLRCGRALTGQLDSIKDLLVALALTAFAI
jgi:hypothetical protein